jgi:RNA-directed DNA polymerase
MVTRERERERESKEAPARKGIPIGNLTSQLFANVYMNEFDQFVKHVLKIKYYARHTDDFVIVSDSAQTLELLIPRIQAFLCDKLKLSLHPDKVSILPYHRGTDFLGQIVFPHHRLLRTKTKKRMWRKLREKVRQYKYSLITEEKLHQSLQSYLGVLSQVDAYETTEKLKNQFWFWLSDIR